MSLLSVTVKRAKFVGPSGNQLNTYVTLQLQNVKSTTITVKGSNPAWEQDFLFETNCLDTGLLIEVWNKGLIWDKALGHYWLPLHQVPYTNQEGTGQWISLDAEQIMENGVVVGTRNPTGDYLLIDCRFELPYDAEDVDSSGMQRKLEAYNHVLDQEMVATLRDSGNNKRRQQQFLNHSGLSEDSDYTSEVNYPMVHQANGSASQYLSAAGQYPSPQRSSGDISRENSYEISDHGGQHHQHHTQYNNGGDEHNQHWSYDYGGYPTQGDGYDYNYDQSEEFYNQSDQWPRAPEEPLYYNSRPNKELKTTGQSNTSSTLDSSVRRSTAQHNSATLTTRSSTLKEEKQEAPTSGAAENGVTIDSSGQKPGLERQSTLYDEHEASTASIYADYYDSQYADGAQQQQYSDYSTDGYQDPETYSADAYQQYDGSGEYGDYNYDYNYGYTETTGQAEGGDAGSSLTGDGGSYVIDDGSQSHGYGYYDETGYYYDGIWYNYDSEGGSWPADEQQQQQPGQQPPDVVEGTGAQYDYSGYQGEELYSSELDVLDTTQPSELDPWQQHDKVSEDLVAGKPTDIFTKRRVMMHHGDLSSSGGSVDSELPSMRRRESIGSVTTPTGPVDYGGIRPQAESPLMMLGELDRLQSDLLSSHRNSNGSTGMMTIAETEYGHHDPYGSGNNRPEPSPQQSLTDLSGRRRDSIASRSSQQSRRERAEGFRRRRSASICSDRDRDVPVQQQSSSPYNNSFDENDRTPVNEMNLSIDMNDVTPDASMVPFPGHQKSISFEDDDQWPMNEQLHDGHHHIHQPLNDGQMLVMDEPERRPLQQQLISPKSPPPDPLISAPPTQQTSQQQQQQPQPTVMSQDRPKLTPRQKWLWAFNKICAQLVSPSYSSLIFDWMSAWSFSH